MSCGDCTLCCTVQLVDMEPLQNTTKPAMTTCEHCTGGGCAVYETRPAACRTFQCTWLATQAFPVANRFPPEERPDRTGIVIAFNSENTALVHCRTPDSWRGALAHKRLMSFVAFGYDVTITHGDGRVSVLERDGSATELEFAGIDPVTKEGIYRRPKGQNSPLRRA